MSDETPTVDCHECHDLAFARNLVRQMKEGYGRWNSNLSFRPRSFYIGDREGVRLYGRAADEAIARETMQIWRENQQQARVIGRFNDRLICARWQDCQPGDAVRAEDFGYAPPDALFVERIEPRRPFCWTFERVVVRTTPDNGRTWADTHLWKRLS